MKKEYYKYYEIETESNELENTGKGILEVVDYLRDLEADIVRLKKDILLYGEDREYFIEMLIDTLNNQLPTEIHYLEFYGKELIEIGENSKEIGTSEKYFVL